MYERVGKVVFDRVFAAVALTILSPLLLIVAVSIRLETDGGVFFQQQRVGHHRRLFNLYKFRTMTVDGDRVLSQTTGGSAGVTRVGRWLRRLKIDELPQLINVLLGDMSVVGPRPCMESHLATMSELGMKRFGVLPGLTGMAQVNGNIALSWAERHAFDAQYVAKLSFFLDIRLIVKTLLVVVVGEQKFKKGNP